MTNRPLLRSAGLAGDRKKRIVYVLNTDSGRVSRIPLGK
jgi:hypothetical protein